MHGVHMDHAALARSQGVVAGQALVTAPGRLQQAASLVGKTWSVAPVLPPPRCRPEASSTGKELAVLALAVSTLMALVVGWLAGMLTPQRPSHWCPYDGAQLPRPECANAGL